MRRSLRGLYVIRGGAPGVTLVDNPQPGDPITPEQLAHLRAKGDLKAGDVLEASDAGDGLGMLEVKFSTFNTWYRIDSFWEGTFLERTVPGAFKKTLAERGAQNKILFNHGMDFNIGDKALAIPEEYGERKDSPFLAGQLFDTSYNRDLLPGLRAGAYGSSFMFEVIGESWDNEPERSDYNPDGIPERTIHEARTFEAGPVTWPANPDATAGLRSGTDWYGSQVCEHDKDQYEDLVRSFAAFRTLNGLHVPTGAPESDSADKPKTPAPVQGRHATGIDQAARKRYASILMME